MASQMTQRRRRSWWLVLATSLTTSLTALPGVGSATHEEERTYSNPTPITSVDVGPASPRSFTPYPVSVDVTGQVGRITHVSVTLHGFSHTWPADVDVLLVGPHGHSTMLMSDTGGRCDVLLVTVVIDDTATASLPEGCGLLADRAPITAGTYRPTDGSDCCGYPTVDHLIDPAPRGPYGAGLSVFNGTDPNGVWRLYVFDDWPFDGGSFAGGFSLTITTSAPFVVNDTGDRGDAAPGDGACETVVGNAECTLRAALEEANAHPGADLITFDIAGAGPHTIRPLSALPALTEPATLDGFTQPGASANTNGPAAGSNAVLMIELDGSSAGNAHGLRLSGGNSTVRGLVINRFQGSGIRIDTAGGNTVSGNYIGTDPAGVTAFGNNVNPGVGIHGGLGIVGVSHNIVGGTAPADRNVISGGHFVGVLISGGDAGSDNLVQGNFIGTNAAGTGPLGNAFGVWPNAARNTIGGTTPAARNVISGNAQAGVLFSGAFGTNNVVRGNYIGTDVTGAVSVANTRGLWILLPDNTIGGTTPGAGNVIAGNGVGVSLDGVSNPNPTPVTGNLVQGNRIGIGTAGPLGNSSHGVQIDAASQTTVDGNTIAFNGGNGVSVQRGAGNALHRNTIFSNGGLGIDLAPAGVTPNDAGDGDTGANNLQNFPVLHAAITTDSGTTIQGTLDSTPATRFTVTFFSNVACDGSGFGEGETSMGSAVVTTNAGGHASFLSTTSTVPAGQFITAVATDPDDNTSEFSRCVEVRGRP